MHLSVPDWRGLASALNAAADWLAERAAAFPAAEGRLHPFPSSDQSDLPPHRLPIYRTELETASADAGWRRLACLCWLVSAVIHGVFIGTTFTADPPAGARADTSIISVELKQFEFRHDLPRVTASMQRTEAAEAEDAAPERERDDLLQELADDAPLATHEPASEAPPSTVPAGSDAGLAEPGADSAPPATADETARESVSPDSIAVDNLEENVPPAAIRSSDRVEILTLPVERMEQGAQDAAAPVMQSGAETSPTPVEDVETDAAPLAFPSSASDTEVIILAPARESRGDPETAGGQTNPEHALSMTKDRPADGQSAPPVLEQELPSLAGQITPEAEGRASAPEALVIHTLSDGAPEPAAGNEIAPAVQAATPAEGKAVSAAERAARPEADPSAPAEAARLAAAGSGSPARPATEAKLAAEAEMADQVIEIEATEASEGAGYLPRSQRRRGKQATAGPSETGRPAGKGRGGTRGSAANRAASADAYRRVVQAQVARNRPADSTYGGRVVVGTHVSKSGALRRAWILRSSGNAVLDQAALAAVGRAAPFPPPPADVSADRLRYAIPFEFR